MSAAPFHPEAGARDSWAAYVDANRAIIRSECDYVKLPHHRVRTLHPGLPCDSCGSVEYVPHSGLMVCSYCRTPQESVASKPPVASREQRALDYEKMRAEVALERERSKIQSAGSGYAALIASVWG